MTDDIMMITKSRNKSINQSYSECGLSNKQLLQGPQRGEEQLKGENARVEATEWCMVGAFLVVDEM